jgi:hypothetical protein
MRAILITSADFSHVNVGHLDTANMAAGVHYIPIRLGFSGTQRSEVEGGNPQGGEGFLRIKVPNIKQDPLPLTAKVVGDSTEFSIDKKPFLDGLRTAGIQIPNEQDLAADKLIFQLSTDEQMNKPNAVKSASFFLTDAASKHSLLIEIASEDTIKEKLKNYLPGLKASSAAGRNLFENHFYATPIVVNIQREIVDEEDRKIADPIKKGWYLIKHRKNKDGGAYLVLPSLTFGEPAQKRSPMLLNALNDNADQTLHFEMEATSFINEIVLPSIQGKKERDDDKLEEFELECFIPGSKQAQNETACKKIENDGKVTYTISGDLPLAAAKAEGTDVPLGVDFILRNRRKAVDNYIVTISRKFVPPATDAPEPSIQARSSQK